jgi:hypothetical protein
MRVYIIREEIGDGEGSIEGVHATLKEAENAALTYLKTRPAYYTASDRVSVELLGNRQALAAICRRGKAMTIRCFCGRTLEGHCGVCEPPDLKSEEARTNAQNLRAQCQYRDPGSDIANGCPADAVFGGYCLEHSAPEYRKRDRSADLGDALPPYGYLIPITTDGYTGPCPCPKCVDKGGSYVLRESLTGTFKCLDCGDTWKMDDAYSQFLLSRVLR